MIGYHLDHEPYSIAMLLGSNQFLRTIMELFTWCWGDSTTPPESENMTGCMRDGTKNGGGCFHHFHPLKKLVGFFRFQATPSAKRNRWSYTSAVKIPFENKVFLGPPKNSLRNPLAVLGFSSMKGLTKIKKTALLRKKNKTQNAGHLSMIR